MKGVVKSFSRLKGYGFIQSKELEQKEVLGTLKKYLVEITDAKISITPTKLSIGYANLYDLNRILQTLKIIHWIY